ncbi:MAG: diacylglycerol kinase family lipid kinase [Epulopiscium sp.]|nr:diacylglycerol kinase family lipid kinase [Candidatus Epulonipiscium sp.]
MKIRFIINPIAGKGKAGSFVPIIQETMKKHQISYEIRKTKGPLEATRLAQEAVEQGYTKVVAVGGDGTISEVINALVHTNVSVGMMAGGTGNDICRTLQIPFDPEEALQVILWEEAHLIDVGKINEYYFINIASLGLDAEIAYWVKNAKRWFRGSAAYIVSVIKNLITYRFQNIEVNFNEKQMTTKMLLLAIANGKYYGGGMMIAPDAQVDDKVFDICLIEKISKWKVGILFPTILKGKHTKFKEVSTHKAEQLCIEKTSTNLVNIDGEIYEIKSPICFSIVPHSLRVIYKKGSK